MSRAGRRRKAGKREPNGRISRTIIERAARGEASADAATKATRSRIHGVKPEDAGTDLAGTALGRMLLRGEISPRQYEAGQRIAERHRAYAHSIASPSPTAKAVSIDGARGTSLGRDQTAREAEAALIAWKEVVTAMDAKGFRGHVYGLLFDLVITDREPRRDVSPLLYIAGLDAVADCCGLHLDKPAEAA